MDLPWDISNTDAWPHFLRYLADVKMYNTDEIISVVEKPWKWEKEFVQWDEAGQPDE